MRVLLVEDDLQLARDIHQTLRSEGFTANHVTYAKSALLTIKTNGCDMLILDLGFGQKNYGFLGRSPKNR